MLSIRLTNFVRNPEIALEQNTGERYLCVKGIHVWVSEIKLTKPDFSMPANCSEGCLYVDNVAEKICTPIDKLEELYCIEMEVSVPQSTADILKSIFRANPKAVLDMLDRKDVEDWLNGA